MGTFDWDPRVERKQESPNTKLAKSTNTHIKRRDSKGGKKEETNLLRTDWVSAVLEGGWFCFDGRTTGDVTWLIVAIAITSTRRKLDGIATQRERERERCAREEWKRRRERVREFEFSSSSSLAEWKRERASDGIVRVGGLIHLNAADKNKIMEDEKKIQ